MALRNVTRGTVLATDVRWATNPWTRFVGLMGRKGMAEGEALVLPGEKGLHTHFMRFAIDVVFYDKEWVVVEVCHALRPWRFSPYKWEATGVVELPAGMAAATGTQASDRLALSQEGLASLVTELCGPGERGDNAGRMAISRVIAITNQKGGVGKTTTSINLSAALADLGHRTLLVDMDPQAHSTLGLGIDSVSLPQTVFHALTAEVPLTDILQETGDERLHVAPAGMDLAFADEALQKVVGRDLRLKRRLEQVQDLFDYVVIDAPAQLNLLTINTMGAATEVIVPLQSQYYSIAGLSQLLETIRLMQSWVNPDLKIGGLLVTQYDKRSALHRQTVERLREEAGAHFRVFDTVVPFGLRAQHAARLHAPVVRAFPTSPVAQAYKELAAEVALVRPG